MSVEILSRIQYAYCLTFHYIYPPMSIGLSVALVCMMFMYVKHQTKEWENTVQFWIKVFALTFALGVASGIPLPFGFGTNWSRYSKYVGDVFGAILGAEGFFAFLVETGFLGILLFGWGRVKPGVHLFATIMVCLATHFSGFWIVIANSWMQTPAGHVIGTSEEGMQVAQVNDFWSVMFNPSSMQHVSHVFIGAWLTGSFLMISIASYYLMKNRHKAFAIRSMKLAVFIAFTSCILQLVSADSLARVIAKHNPAKLAAFEGVFKTQDYTPAFGFGLVDVKNETVYGPKVPGLLSWLVYRNAKTPVAGLDQFPKDEWPPVQAVFQTYHIMIAMWGIMMLASCIGLYMWIRKKWVLNKWIMRFLVISATFPQIGNLAGWYSTELGRQPWVVYGLLRTKDAFTPTLTVAKNMISLTIIASIYTLLFVLFLFLLDAKIKHGPTDEAEEVAYRDPEPKKGAKHA